MSFLGEIRRRKVFQVAAVYAVVAWLIIQIIDVVSEPLSLPVWLDTVVIVLLAVGFPVAVILAWAFDLTPEGVVKDTGTVQSSGRRIEYALIGLLVVAVGFLFFDAYVPEYTPIPAADPADRRSIAVLPLENLSPDPDNAYFADGIHGELLTTLANIGSLKVISRTSVMEYRDSPKNMREIGQELNVATILEGDVRRAGDTVRINVQLIDANTDEHLWAEIYEREMTVENIFAIQSDIATRIAEALETALTPEEEAQINEVPTQNLRAHDFYLLAKEYSDRGDDALAEQMLIQATEEDPEFVAAWIDLAWTHAIRYWNDEATEERRQLAFDAVQTALQLAPDDPEVHWALGNYYYRTSRDYERALAEYSIAEQGIAGRFQATNSTAFVQRRVAQWDEALASFDRSIELDPRNTTTFFMKAGTYLALRDYAQAESTFEQAIELQPDSDFLYSWMTLIPLLSEGDVAATRAVLADPDIPRDDHYYWAAWLAAIYDRNFVAAIDTLSELSDSFFLDNRGYHSRASLYGVTYQLAGNADLARAHFLAGRTQLENLLETRPEDARLHVSLGETLAGLGDNEGAIAAARRGMELLPVSRDTYNGPAVQLDAAVRVFVAAQDYDAAITELDGYFDAPGQWSIEGLAPDPRLDPIRDDPRFQALIEKYSR